MLHPMRGVHHLPQPRYRQARPLPKASNHSVLADGEKFGSGVDCPSRGTSSVVPFVSRMRRNRHPSRACCQWTARGARPPRTSKSHDSPPDPSPQHAALAWRSPQGEPKCARWRVERWKLQLEQPPHLQNGFCWSYSPGSNPCSRNCFAGTWIAIHGYGPGPPRA